MSQLLNEYGRKIFSDFYRSGHFVFLNIFVFSDSHCWLHFHGAGGKTWMGIKLKISYERQELSQLVNIEQLLLKTQSIMGQFQCLSADEWINKKCAVFIQWKLLSHARNEILILATDGWSRGHYVKWKKSDTKDYLYSLTHRKCSE